MIWTECRVIPAPRLTEAEVRAISKGFIVDVDDDQLRTGDAFELVSGDCSFWAMCRVDWHGFTVRRMSAEEIAYAADHGHPLGGGRVRRVETPYVTSKGDTVYIDIATCELTYIQVLNEIARLKAAHPDQEIFMDGEDRTIKGRRRSEP